MIGLVLEGGGAKGAYHCGAVKALYDAGYRFDGVAGTSIGAINAAMIVQDGGYETLWKAWSEVTAADIVGISREQAEALLAKNFSVKTAEYWAKELLSVMKNAGVPTDNLMALLKKYINEKALRASKADYALVTYCLSDRKPLELFKEDIPVGSLHEYILASAYYPLFRLNRLGGKYYLDGGVYDNLPVGVLAARGYDEIIAVRTKSKTPKRPVYDPDVKVKYIVPSERLGNTFNQSQEKVELNKKTGYYDAMRLINGYVGQKYYVKENGNTAKRVIGQLNEKDIAELTGQSAGRLETIFSRDRRTEKTNLTDALITYVEPLATTLKAEKYRVYSEDEFFEMIKDATAPEDKKFFTSQKNEMYEKILCILRRIK
ncbi:MAG: patatin-like phospholipase family protein [Clostridia bacterium]|nr:patatin-like phospholipase family protein [Clostridia bacterium]